MTKVHDIEYLGRRDLLVACWKYVPEAIGLLAPAAQIEIHRVYEPSQSLNDNEFLVHMRAVFAADPSLAQRVGKHYNRIFTVYKSYADRVGKTNFAAIRRCIRHDFARENWDPFQKKQVIAMPIVNPELDFEKLARALLEQVRYESINGKNSRKDIKPSSPQALGLARTKLTSPISDARFMAE